MLQPIHGLKKLT